MCGSDTFRIHHSLIYEVLFFELSSLAPQGSAIRSRELVCGAGDLLFSSRQQKQIPRAASDSKTDSKRRGGPRDGSSQEERAALGDYAIRPEAAD
jgi:hypothetical protein